MTIQISALDHLVVNVTDAEKSAAWYEQVLGMTRRDFDPGEGQPKRIAMHFGKMKINLRPVSASKVAWFTAAHEAAGSDDLCFLTAASPQQVVDHLTSCGVAIAKGPCEQQGGNGTLQSVYCRDPDGSLIEIASYKSTAP